MQPPQQFQSVKAKLHYFDLYSLSKLEIVLLAKNRIRLYFRVYGEYYMQKMAIYLMLYSCLYIV